MFSVIDWVLRHLADIFSYALTTLIRWVLMLFGANTSILDNEHYKGAVNFFFYDTMKIFLMLIVIIFIVSIIRSFFPPEKTKKLLGEGKARGFIGNVLAALLGIVTPFCSCSAVPVFIGFIESGIPLGITFSFLISSPMVNEVALVMLWGLFGWQIALLYIATGVMLAKEMGVNATFEKVQDIQKIMSYGIMSTPALVIDEKVKVYGKVPNKDVIKKYIEEEM